MYDEIVERWKRANPIGAHYLGFHEYDGQFPNFSDAARAKRVKEIQLDLETIHQMEEPDDKMAKFEKKLVISTLQEELFELVERQEFKSNPLTMIYPLMLVESSYTVRNFAPRDDRIRSIIKFEENLPIFLNIGLDLLKESIPKAKIDMSLKFLKGMLFYFRDNLIAFIVKTDDEDLINQWSDANILAIEAMEKLESELRENYLPKAHDDFALGKDKFMKLLKITEGVDVSYDELLQAGQEDLNRNYDAMLAHADKVPDLDEFLEEIREFRPDPDKLVEEANKTLDRTRKFLEETGIVPLPSDDHCEIIETPEFARSFAFAAMNTPGPFEVDTASEAYYWITPPNLEWPVERINQFMSFFNYPFLEIVTIHEVYPGHFVQLLYNRHSKSEISKMMARSTSMIEGWAHYAEEMIFNQGYDAAPFDRTKLKVGQLLGALMRNCRYISALKMHCENWTPEDAKQLFIEKGFIAEPNAEIEANRGTIDPMYLNYTLGKLLIKKLRVDYKKEKGDEFDLSEFHKELLSFGSPPIAILRDVMLENDNGKLI